MMNKDEKFETYRKRCLAQQTELRKVLSKRDQFEQGMVMFLDQHALLHSSKISAASTWSFEDVLLEGMNEEQLRRIPPKQEHAIVWILWHIARIEDVTMNLLVAGSPQIYLKDKWPERLHTSWRHTGNEMDRAQVQELSQSIDVEALRAYRLATGRRTREIVRQLQPEDLERKVNPEHLQRVSDEGAVVAEAQGILDYWSKRDIAGLLLMPATRHSLIHLNEALKVKQRLL